MAGQRVALLVGVSEYGKGYSPLPGTVTDLERMQQVLQNPDMGGFNVEVLRNPEPQPFREAIEGFFRGRHRDDVVLFYFSGHGALDNATSSQLYLSTCQTRKEAKQLVESSAVEAAWLHRHLVNSKSQQKIVILDCCFSGAVANLLTKGDEVVNLQQLEAKGTVLLASCSAFEVSYQTKETAAEVDLAQSLYTRYLVEGIETGAARQGKYEWIYTQDLHDYAKRRFQTELAAATEPQIIVVEQEGYRIPIARTPKGDPKVEYRQIVAELLQENDGDIDELDQVRLEIEREELDLSVEEMQQILEEQQKPYRIRKQKRAKYARAFETALNQGYPISAKARKTLKLIQQRLSLKDEDVNRIEAELLPDDAQVANQPSDTETAVVNEQPRQQDHEAVEPQQQSEDDDLSSEKGIDYTRLRDLLKAQNFKDADQETFLRMLEAVGRENGNYLIRREELMNFPCTDLKTIDRLWVKYSNGKFGFSVQKEIYVQCGAKLDGNCPGDKIWEEFGDRVGWRGGGILGVGKKWIRHSDVTFNTSAPRGHLPQGCGVIWKFEFWGKVGYLSSRIADCKM